MSPATEDDDFKPLNIAKADIDLSKISAEQLITVEANVAQLGGVKMTSSQDVPLCYIAVMLSITPCNILNFLYYGDHKPGKPGNLRKF